MATRVIIPESTETCNNLWKSAFRKGILLEVFSGLLGTPRGILATLEEDPAFVQNRPEDYITVVLSNGWTVNVPKGDTHILSAQGAPV